MTVWVTVICPRTLFETLLGHPRRVLTRPIWLRYLRVSPICLSQPTPENTLRGNTMPLSIPSELKRVVSRKTTFTLCCTTIPLPPSTRMKLWLLQSIPLSAGLRSLIRPPTNMAPFELSRLTTRPAPFALNPISTPLSMAPLLKVPARPRILTTVRAPKRATEQGIYLRRGRECRSKLWYWRKSHSFSLNYSLWRT